MITADYTKQLDEALVFMKDHASFLVVSHVQPDGDAVSSTLVVAWLLKQMGKSAVMVNESELPTRLHFLNEYDRIQSLQSITITERFDAVIAVDCADYQRIGEATKLFAPHVQLLNIDHHPTNNAFGTVNLIHTKAAATVEILFDMIQRTGYTIDIHCATAIYTGLLTDTGGFRYSNTSSHVMQVASQLLAVGVSGSLLADLLLEKMTIAKLKLLQMALSRITFSEKLDIGWLYISKEDLNTCGAISEDLEGLVNYALNVDGVEVGILFKETDDGAVKASLRSAGKADVAVIAQKFGGGGHVRASGCRIEGTLPDVMEKLVNEVRRALM